MEQLDVQSERIQGDLRGLIRGSVRCDDLFCQLFANDGSIYEIRPLGVVCPRNTADIIATVQYAAEKQIPIHPRGAGTAATGGSIGPGLILDLSQYLHRIVKTDENWVRVQSGTPLERLNHHLGRNRQHFGPTPTNRPRSTVGGAIAVDAAGSHWPKYGSTRRHVKRLQVVLADGCVIDAGLEPLNNGRSMDPNPRKRDLIDRLVALVRRFQPVILAGRPTTPVDHCGYQINNLLNDDGFDLASLLTGSEGTLSLITEATLDTEPLPHHRAVALLLFDSLERTLSAIDRIASHQPTACVLLDRRYLSLARQTEVRFHVLIPEQTEAVLVVELDDNQPEELQQRLECMVDEIRYERHLAFGVRQAFDSTEVSLFWHLAARIQPALSRLEGSARPVPVIDDIAIPVNSLADFLIHSQNILKRHQVTASLSAHPLSGEFQFQPFLELGHPSDVQKMRKITEELYEETILLGGTISAHRGCGLVRTPFVQRQAGPLFDLFREIKQIFDPDGLFNPGKIVDGRWSQFTRDLRPVPVLTSNDTSDDSKTDRPEGLRNLVELQLNWDPSQLVETVVDCTGCGDCRSQTPDERMCPFFRVSSAEESSPRAKVNLIRGVLTGRLDLQSLSSDEFKRIADLCFSCHICHTECPSEVDIPHLVAQSKGAYVTAKGLPLTDYALSHIDRLLALAAIFPRLSNWGLSNRQIRWLLEKVLGIAQGRKLPPIDRRPFLRRAARKRLTKPRRQRDRKVAYFVDTYANHNDPELAEALIAILKHHDIAIFVPPKQKPAGTTAIACGDLEFARRLAARNTAVLADAIRQGYHILTTEPAATVTLQREYLQLVDDDESRLVAENSSDACHYLWQMHTQGKLRLDLKPIEATIAYHLPCRLAALGIGAPGENLLHLIPKLSVRRIDAGCSGMGGTFGLRAKNYRTSLRMGWGLISALRDPKIQAGTTECSMCKIQMEQGTPKPTIHPLKLMAISYGLLPPFNSFLQTQSKELLTT